MKYKQWNDLPKGTGEEALRRAGVPALCAKVLSARGWEDAEAARQFLFEDHPLHDPMAMADMDRAVERLEKALNGGETIAVYGDYDVDGITATCLVTDALRRAGADCVRHIPHRIDDGYGLNCAALQALREGGVSLVVTVDCGITGVEEAAFARKIGLSLVITDHHECKDTLPEADAVVNPHRPDCPYPFKNLAGVGVALKLVMALAGEREPGGVFQRYCTLAAIGTVADVMSMTGENRMLVRCGLERIHETPWPGLRALLREAGLAEKPVSSTNIGFILAPRINAAGRMGQADMAAELFLTEDETAAGDLARQLCELNRARQNVEQEIFAEAQARIETMPLEERHALVLESGDWHQGVVGIVASRLSEKYSCPSFMIHLNGAVGKGSCRSFGAFNLFAALEECQDLLLGFGGHELAAGFTIERDKIPAFRCRMNELAERYFGAGAPVSCLEVDAEITHPDWMSLGEVEALQRLEPYGADNQRPLFCIQGLTVSALQNVGQNKHLKMHFFKGTTQLDGIFFSANTDSCGVAQGDRVDAAFYLNVNEFRGSRTVQMQLADVRLSLAPSHREREDLLCMERFLEGGTVTPQEAVHMIPERGQFAGCWRTLEQYLPAEEAWETPYLPLLRKLEKHMGGVDPFLRAMVCLTVFADRGLIALERRDGVCRLRRLPIAGKADLQASPYMQALQAIQSKR